MRRVLSLSLIAAASLLLSACSDGAEPEPGAQGIPAELRAIMSANRASALPPLRADFDKAAQRLLTPGLTLEGDLGVRSDIDGAPGPGGGTGSDPMGALLSHAQIAEEIDFLFRLLRYAYAGYQYFGGDAVFLPMRDAMLERLAAMPDPLPVFSYLHDILAPALRREIADEHFSIGNVTIGARWHALRMSDEHVLRRDRSGFVVEIDGSLHRVVETARMDGRAADGILPTITREGEFAHAFGLFAAEDDWGARALSVLLENDATGERSSIIVDLPRAPNYRPESRPLIYAREESGIAIVESRNLRPTDSGSNGMFHRQGASLRGARAAVLDLRGNSGGSAELARNWIAGFTGRRPAGFAFAGFWLRSASNGGGAGRPGFPPAWEPSARPPAGLQTLPNDGLLIVLTDSNTASAGDLFVGYLRELENVLFVGANTAGVLVTGRVISRTLPNSGLPVAFGATLNLRPDFSQFEGVGFLPDLWAPPGESLERALAFVERYGLNR